MAQRIVHVIDTGGPGGAETVLVRIAGAQRRAGVELTVVVSRDDWLAGALRGEGIEPVILGPAGGFDFAYLRALARLIRDRQPDVVHAHLYGSAPYCALAGRWLGVPVLTTFHGIVDLSGRGPVAWVRWWVTRLLCRALVFVSEPLRSEASLVVPLPANGCHVVHNGVDMVAFQPDVESDLRAEFRIPEGEFLIGAVGNVRAPKGYAHLVDAIRILVDRGHACRLLIFGQGDGQLLEDLQRRIAERELDRRVHLAGFRSSSSALYVGFDCYVVSSTSEGFSISCVEALACGRPVVATRSGGPESILTHNHTGILVDPGSASALADGLERVMQDRPAAQALGQAGRADVSSRFSLEAMTDAYQQLYEGMG